MKYFLLLTQLRLRPTYDFPIWLYYTVLAAVCKALCIRQAAIGYYTLSLMYRGAGARTAFGASMATGLLIGYIMEEYGLVEECHLDRMRDNMTEKTIFDDYYDNLHNNDARWVIDQLYTHKEITKGSYNLLRDPDHFIYRRIAAIPNIKKPLNLSYL